MTGQVAPVGAPKGDGMKEKIGWGILGAGAIAARFATDLAKLPDARRVAVGSRSRDKAGAFAQAHGFERAHGSYEELIADEDVDIIYVATPHNFHREHSIACLRGGKAVLCEKPLAVNDGQVAEMIAVARSEGLFLMEAMWTRFLPAMVAVREWLAEGRIGEPRQLTADFGFRAGVNPEGRLFNPDLAGGALLDVGVYVVALAYMVYGGPPKTLLAAGHLGETGVDEQTGMLLAYPGGALARLSCAVRTNTPQEARIDGTDGRIVVPGFWHATHARLERSGAEPELFTGEASYHYEAAEAMRCLRQGKLESEIMPLDESLAISRTLTKVRGLIGLRYPME